MRHVSADLFVCKTVLSESGQRSGCGTRLNAFLISRLLRNSENRHS